MSFVHLHTHSSYSPMSGVPTVETLCQTAKAQGHEFLALTDTNGLYGANHFLQVARETGLKPILGAELVAGMDRAVLIADAAAAGSDLLGTSRALAAALEREGPDLVLFGQASNDGDGAMLWAAVAELLQRPAISQVATLTVDGGELKGKRQTEHGYDTISAPLPAIVAVSDAINEPRYPSLKGIMGAKTKPQETLSLSDLGVDAGAVGEAGARTEVHDLGPPPSRGDSITIEDDGSAAQKILDLVLERRLL